MRRLLLVFTVLLVACSSDEPETVRDSGVDARADSAIDCSMAGCAPPPPCGQPCTDVCGCCPNYTCNDGGADANDTAAPDAPDAD